MRKLLFGPIDSVSIAQSGFGFEENIQPIFRVKDATGNRKLLLVQIL